MRDWLSKRKKIFGVSDRDLASYPQVTEILHISSPGKQRKSKNFLKGLMDMNGTWSENSNDMEGIILARYNTLFKSDH